MSNSAQLEVDDLVLGVMYRGKNPRNIATIFRDVYDDRILVWLSPDRTVLQYDGPGVPKGMHTPTVKTEDFLAWVSHAVVLDEG